MGNPTDSPLKTKGNFSRKHETAAQHQESRDRYLGGYNSPRECRQARSTERANERAARTPAEQIVMLDVRNGVGVGAVRERARLLENKVATVPVPESKPKTSERDKRLDRAILADQAHAEAMFRGGANRGPGSR